MDVTYGRVEDEATKLKVARRFYRPITDLEAMGFKKLCIATEVMSPFSVITKFLIYLIMLAYRHPMFIGSPLRIGGYVPMMVHPDTSTFAAVQPLGVKYYTRFTDKTVLVTSNFATKTHSDDIVKFYKYADDGAAMELAYRYHHQRIQAFIEQGKKLSPDLRYEQAIEMSEVEDRYLHS